MMRLSLLLIVCLVFGFYSTAQAQKFNAFSEDDRARLQDGEILVWEEKEPGNEKRFIVSVILLEHSLQEVWDLIDDKEAIPEVIESVVKAEVLSREGMTTLISQEVKGLNVTKNAFYVVKHVGIYPSRVEFHRVSGDFEHIEGAWLFEVIKGSGGESQTLLTYRLHLDAGKYIPQRLIIRSQLKKLPLIMTAIQRRLGSAQ
tara:strand:- start:904 stop:1506 length:603 start_codon:yes stop_codon:yes gene_type:complete